MVITAAMVAIFVTIHLFVGRLRFLDTAPRSKWLSFSGGVAVAYVFLHVLPELGAHQHEFATGLGVAPVVAESAVYSLALAGLALFYGLERAVKMHRSNKTPASAGGAAGDGVLYLHLASYGAFNVLIGYLLLHREDHSAGGLGLYFVAMALHFVTADFGMRQDHRAGYDQVGRWIISAAVVLGWMLGLTVALSQVLIGCLFAFLAGGIILNVLKEELPEERQSYFAPFLGGVLLYAVLVFAERLLI